MTLKDDVCVFASCMSVLVFMCVCLMHVCSYGHGCVLGRETCPYVCMLVRCMTVATKGCAYVIKAIRKQLVMNHNTYFVESKLGDWILIKKGFDLSKKTLIPRSCDSYQARGVAPP